MWICSRYNKKIILFEKILIKKKKGINTALVPVYIKDISPVEISGRAGGIN